MDISMVAHKIDFSYKEDSMSKLRELEEQNRNEFLSSSGNSSFKAEENLSQQNVYQFSQPLRNFGIFLLGASFFSLFFLSQPITGNVIATLTKNSYSWTGGALLLIGLIGSFIYFRKAN